MLTYFMCVRMGQRAFLFFLDEEKEVNVRVGKNNKKKYIFEMVCKLYLRLLFTICINIKKS